MFVVSKESDLDEIFSGTISAGIFILDEHETFLTSESWDKSGFVFEIVSTSDTWGGNFCTFKS